jgi:hypothetical protein
MPKKNLTILKPKVAGTLGPVFIVCKQSHFMPSKLKWENLLPLMGEGSPILSSGSFSDLIKAVLSTKSSIFFVQIWQQ